MPSGGRMVEEGPLEHLGVLWGLPCRGLILASPIICLGLELSSLPVVPCHGSHSEAGTVVWAGQASESPVRVTLCVWVRSLGLSAPMMTYRGRALARNGGCEDLVPGTTACLGGAASLQHVSLAGGMCLTLPLELLALYLVVKLVLGPEPHGCGPLLCLQGDPCWLVFIGEAEELTCVWDDGPGSSLSHHARHSVTHHPHRMAEKVSGGPSQTPLWVLVLAVRGSPPESPL